MKQSSNQLLCSFLAQSSHNNQYLKALEKGILDYQLKPFNIMKLSPSSILDIYNVINSKYSTHNSRFYLNETH